MIGVRNTIQKKLVYDAVVQMKNHPTAEMIYEHILKNHNKISIATVYRTLSHLSEDGEILKVDITNAPSIYDFNIKNHHHFKCLKCGNVYDYIISGVDNIETIIKNDENFSVESIELVIKGLCVNCKHK